MKTKKRKQAPSVAYSIPPSSYTLQTANAILRQYGIEFAKDDLVALLKNNQSFYKKLLILPANIIYNDYFLQQCYDMQYYCAEQVINLIFANSTARAAHPEGESALNESRMQRIMGIQDINTEYDEELQSLQQQQDQLIESTYENTYQALSEWETLISTTVDKITVKLQQLGFTLSSEFRSRLSKNLAKQGLNIHINQEILADFQIKEEISNIEKAILSSLIEETPHG